MAIPMPRAAGAVARVPAVRPGWTAPSKAAISRVKVLLFVLCLLPLARLVGAGFADAQGWALPAWLAPALTLGTNPVEFVTRSTGTWTIALLCVSLVITPLRRLTGANWLVRLRRMLGLFAFFHAALHFTTYVWFDQWFDVDAILKDVWKRPFITVGFLAFVLLLPLALTSTDGMMRRLGRRWGRLHRLVYPIAILGVVHYWWLVKRDLTQPAIYAMVVALLLGARVAWWLRREGGAAVAVLAMRGASAAPPASVACDASADGAASAAPGGSIPPTARMGPAAPVSR